MPAVVAAMCSWKMRFGPIGYVFYPKGYGSSTSSFNRSEQNIICVYENFILLLLARSWDSDYSILLLNRSLLKDEKVKRSVKNRILIYRMLSKTNLIYLPTVMLWRCLRGRWQGGDWPKRPPVVSLCLLRIARRRRSVRTQKEQRTQPTRFGINSDRFGALLQFRPRSLRRTLLPACKWLHQRRWQVGHCFLEHRFGTLIFYYDFALELEQNLYWFQNTTRHKRHSIS